MVDPAMYRFMRALLLGVVFGSALLPSGRASADVMSHIDGRRTVSLDGKWAAIVDPYESGYYDFRYRPRGDGYFKNQKPRDKRDLVEYDFDTSETLDVPGDWNSQRESLFFYEGTIWYKRSFGYEKKPGTRVFVHFGAVNYHALVYLN